MITELCGVPASGKTTKAKNMENEKGVARVVIRGRFELLWRSACFYVFHFVLFWKTLYYILFFSATYKLWYTKIIHSIFYRAARYHKASGMKNAVIDEGFFQNLFSVFDKNVSLEILEKYVCLFPKVDSLIYFMQDKNTLIERSRARGYFSREGIISRSMLEDWINVIIDRQDQIYNILQNKPANVVYLTQDSEL